MKIKTLVALVAGLNCIFAALLQAQAPQMFRYQGRLLDNDALVSGNLNFSFKLYSAPTGGAALYEDAATVTVVDGLYSTMIGDDTSSGGDLSAALKNPAVYLEIEVDGETLTPRERIVSVPYAMNDNGLPSGTVVLSTTNPNAALEAEGYSLLKSDITSREDWAVAGDTELINPQSEDGYLYELDTFGDFVVLYSDQLDQLRPVYSSRDGLTWSTSMPPIFALDDVVVNNTLYFLDLDISGNLEVASTSNGTDWNELNVNSPISNIVSLTTEDFKGQIWIFVQDSSGGDFVFKSSDGANWTPVLLGGWNSGFSGEFLDTQSTSDRLLVIAPASGGDSNILYIWSTTDGTSWTQSNQVPTDLFDANLELETSYANDALWTLKVPSETLPVLYKSTDWGNNWVEVSNNLPLINSNFGVDLDPLGSKPGLLLSLNEVAGPGGGQFITENGSEWTQVSNEGYDEDTISSSGQIWLLEAQPGFSDLYSIGGPTRSGRFFHYQKD